MARVPPSASSSGASSERVAGWAFFMFTLFQVPTWIMDTPSTRENYAMLSPLQVTAAHLANSMPASRRYMVAALLPGAWARDALSPYMRCLYKSNWKGPCTLEKARLSNYYYLEGMVSLPALQKLIKSADLKGQQTAIVYGSVMITVSALFAVAYSVKTALVGFLVLAYGVYQSGATPLPPAIMMAFLCLYSGFKLDEVVQRPPPAGSGSGGGAGRAAARNPYGAAAEGARGAGSASAGESKGRRTGKKARA